MRPFVAKVQVSAAGLNQTYRYTYDANGNILSVSDGTNTTSYVYDSANQLVRENNQAGGFTHVWTYDRAGNILSRTEYAYTTGTIGEALDTVVYNYGDSQWGDLLTGYDGRNITSDAIGNPLSDGIRSYTWEHGRQLATVTQNGVTWQNTYNADGLRTKRTDGTNTYEYVYYSGLLQYMEHNGQAVYFTHAPDGTPMGMLTEGNASFYITNLQGDVVAILNSSGQVVVRYTYDAWGNLLSTTGSLASTIGVLNPIRYRGYVYDPETGLYYLQSRYYDPEIGRFINADAFTSTGQGLTGNNMFAYCGNNPVNYVDSYGLTPQLPVGRMGPYGELRKIAAGTGLEVHHFIEQRFYGGKEYFMGYNKQNAPSVILTKSEHQYITNMFRDKYKYGATPYKTLKPDTVVHEAILIYQKYGNNDMLDYVTSVYK